MYGVCPFFLAGELPNACSYTLYLYGSGQPYFQYDPVTSFGTQDSKCPSHNFSEPLSCAPHTCLPPQIDLDEEDFTEEDREEFARRIRSNMDTFLEKEGGLKCPVTVCAWGC
jgi:hypothetical protein